MDVAVHNRLWAGEATRFYTIDPGYWVLPEQTLDAVKLQPFKSEAVFLLGMRGNIRNRPGAVRLANMSDVFFRLWWDERDHYTVGTVPDPLSGTLSLEHGWTCYDNLFSEETLHPLAKLVGESKTAMWVAFQNRSTSEWLWPTLTFYAVKASDGIVPGH